MQQFELNHVYQIIFLYNFEINLLNKYLNKDNFRIIEEKPEVDKEDHVFSRICVHF